ncbi:bifunctional phosphoribosylaminoimidazolecarboxamide formyltransferase/IMP cyclohydrolase [Ferroplasma acidiphilum]|uniref:Bifunctional phosphoribosylaminoimidazolecarboxamide formyltransferase/IMP cyclohydrolase n=1 Tax=Ferroplasma acidiphilum TaxID=74969 RepID=A0A7K4FMZ8_9ARCH|nr:bifunctional phosphoribosylaminoimidazolecarboxamide formyltransferase/IMP cyclohydrolase [Ferroplasma acidiphilum]NOL60305.1 bifunctional phosphoribosylaminoimidazolecarboxamide formyltransferase/IMP cyclohydrolase [Ferroplasma acidiphilum]
MRILISVYDKTGLVNFLSSIKDHIDEIYGTEGTVKYLKENNIAAKNSSNLTGFDDLLGGRVKTLHPAIFSGILSKRDSESNMQLEKYHYKDFDMVICNLYPFVEASKTDELEKMIENIDIGGLSLIRAAAKNYKNVAVLSHPDDYSMVKDVLQKNGKIDMKTKEILGLRAFSRSADYDIQIYNRLYRKLNDRQPEELFIHGYDRTDLRYGENPDQEAYMFKVNEKYGIPNSIQLNGKELSYNNILDANAALETVQDFQDITSVIVKHRTPSGVSSAGTLKEAFINSYNADPESAYGFVVALNRKLDMDTAKEMQKKFIEVLIAPEYDTDALNLLKKKKNMRILKCSMDHDPEKAIYSVSGGVLVQSRLDYRYDNLELKSTAEAGKEKLADLEFAWKVVAHAKSNAMVLAKNRTTVGIGAGQTSRIESLKIAIERGNSNVKGSVLASDAFIPFDDSVIECYKNGIDAIIQPGGSIRDDDVIKRCNEYKIPLYFTGKRVFLH